MTARRTDSPNGETAPEYRWSEDPNLSPGAKRALAQREAQGIFDVTDEQAVILARLFAPVPRRERAAQASTSSDSGSCGGNTGRGDLSGEAA